MKIKYLPLTLSLSFPLICAAEAAWISDELQTSVIDKPDVNGQYSGSLSAGTAVEVLETSADGRYVKIKTDTLEGWVWSRNIMNSPSVHQRFAEQSKALAQAQSRNAALDSSREADNATLQQLQTSLAQSQQAAESARAELVALQRASGNVVAIDSRNRELQARVVELEQENLQLRHQNSRLQSRGLQRQMLIGGALVVAGALLSVLLSFLRGIRRRRNLNDL